MVWPCHSLVGGLCKKCIDVHRKRERKVRLVNHDFLPILMLLYIMLVCLKLFAALSDAVCLLLCLMLFVCCFV